MVSQHKAFSNSGLVNWESWFEGLHLPKKKKKRIMLWSCNYFATRRIKSCLFKICWVSNLQLILNFKLIRLNISPAIIGWNQCYHGSSGRIEAYETRNWRWSCKYKIKKKSFVRFFWKEKIWRLNLSPKGLFLPVSNYGGGGSGKWSPKT